MQNKENFYLFVILAFSLSIIVLLSNVSSPLFWLKAQLTLKNWFSQKEKVEETIDKTNVSIGFKQNLVTQPPLSSFLPTKSPVIPTTIPTTNIITPKTTTTTTAPKLGGLPTTKPLPSPLPSPTPFVSSPTEAKTNLVWQSVFKGVSAAENWQDETLLLKVESGTKYVERTYTLKDGRKVKILVPLFRK